MKSTGEDIMLANHRTILPCFLLISLVFLTGCRFFPSIKVTEKPFSPYEWTKIVQNLETLKSGHATQLHIIIWELEENEHVELHMPLWMIRMPMRISTSEFIMNQLEECDHACRIMLNYKLWNSFMTSGTSILVETPTEKVALWFD